MLPLRVFLLLCLSLLSQASTSCKPGYRSSPGYTGTCVDVDECATNNGGCSQICHNIDGGFYCSCRNGYRLTYETTCVDIDECHYDQGGCDQQCTNTPGSFRCSCNPGYQLSYDGRTCTNIDECARNNGGCEQNCADTIGSFVCSCDRGYQFRAPTSCDDIDECRRPRPRPNDCEQICTNTPGSFTCSCRLGYRLAPNHRECININECDDDNAGCDQQCIDTPGSFRCACNRSYELASDGFRCVDINECNNNRGGCEQICVNTIGSFECKCRQGFTVDGRRCTDINECDQDPCQQMCHNTPGSFECACRMGYRLAIDRRSCDDVDECAINNGGCDQICYNNEGSFECVCRRGYELLPNRRSCEDIDECEVNTDGCNQLCFNIQGSFLCRCMKGFVLSPLDNRTCNDIDECAVRNGGCQQRCVNNPGSFECRCQEGFTLSPNGISCWDINECETMNGGCQQICVNNNGSFRCECRPGYVLSESGFHCMDIDECSAPLGAGCQQWCTNTQGGFYCSCRLGFTLDANNSTCTDINECTSNMNNCDQVCINEIGDFRCSCNRSNFMLQPDNATCACRPGFTILLGLCVSDVANIPPMCACEQVCTITNDTGIPRGVCSCTPGYQLCSDDNTTCVDINECLVQRGGCSHICENTDGSFVCSCRQDFQLASDHRSCIYRPYRPVPPPYHPQPYPPPMYPHPHPPPVFPHPYPQFPPHFPYRIPRAPYFGGAGEDPHFAVLLPSKKMLCYSVQGENGRIFNLISNKDLHINALFVPDSRRVEVTWIGSLGITVHSSTYNETSIIISAAKKMITVASKKGLGSSHLKTASFKATAVDTITLVNGKLLVSENGYKDQRHPEVEISLLDLQMDFVVAFPGDEHLDMTWLSVGWQAENSHGIIGQFLRKGVAVDEVRKVLVMPHKEPLPVERRPIWSFMEKQEHGKEERDCWTVLNYGKQGKGLIDGTYMDYIVPELLSTDFYPAKIHKGGRL